MKGLTTLEYLTLDPVKRTEYTKKKSSGGSCPCCNLADLVVCKVHYYCYDLGNVLISLAFQTNKVVPVDTEPSVEPLVEPSVDPSEGKGFPNPGHLSDAPSDLSINSAGLNTFGRTPPPPPVSETYKRSQVIVSLPPSLPPSLPLPSLFLR